MNELIDNSQGTDKSTNESNSIMHNWRENPLIVKLVEENPDLIDMFDTPNFEILLKEFIQNLLDQNEL